MKTIFLLSVLALSGVACSVYGASSPKGSKKQNTVPASVANNLLPSAPHANMDNAIIVGQSIGKTSFFQDLNKDRAPIIKFISDGLQALFPLPTSIDGSTKAIAKVNNLKQKIPLILANPYPLAKIALAMLRQFLAQAPAEICAKDRLYDSFIWTAAGDLLKKATIGTSCLGAIQKAGHPLPESITSSVKGVQPYQLFGREDAINHIIGHTSHNPNENLIGLIFERVGQAIDSFLSQALTSMNNSEIKDIKIDEKTFTIDVKGVQKQGTRTKTLVNVCTVQGVGAALLASYFATLAKDKVSDLQSKVQNIDAGNSVEPNPDLQRFDISNYFTKTPADKMLLIGSNILPIVEFNIDLPVLSQDGHKNAQDPAQWSGHYWPYVEARFDARFARLGLFYIGAMNGWKNDVNAPVQASGEQPQQQALLAQGRESVGAASSNQVLAGQNQQALLENHSLQPNKAEEKKVQALEGDIKKEEIIKQKIETEKATLTADEKNKPQDTQKDNKAIANLNNQEVKVEAQIATDHKKEEQLKAQETRHSKLVPPNIQLPAIQGGPSNQQGQVTSSTEQVIKQELDQQTAVQNQQAVGAQNPLEQGSVQQPSVDLNATQQNLAQQQQQTVVQEQQQQPMVQGQPLEQLQAQQTVIVAENQQEQQQPAPQQEQPLNQQQPPVQQPVIVAENQQEQQPGAQLQPAQQDQQAVVVAQNPQGQVDPLRIQNQEQTAPQGQLAQ